MHTFIVTMVTKSYLLTVKAQIGDQRKLI